MVSHLVFDIGRVLLHWDPELPYRRLIPDPQERAFFLNQVCNGDWNAEQDRGRAWADGEAVAIKAHPQWEEMIRAYRTHWHEMVPYAVPQTPEMVEALVTAGYDVTMLTNFAADTFQEAKGRFSVLSLGRGTTVSGELGLLKPERAIFERHAQEFDLDPSKILFFDDSAANVAGAKAAGWQARLFTDAASMRCDLAEAGFPV
ncbi:MAG: HAD-IA family hydrolase [Pseudomonadota bacterium]